MKNKSVEEADVIVLSEEECKLFEMEALAIIEQIGKTNTATNLEHRMAVIFKNAGLTEYSGALHVFRRTFATRMYEDGARIEDIAAYIGDLVSTTEKYYVAIRKKVKLGQQTKHIVELPKKQMSDNKVG